MGLFSLGRFQKAAIGQINGGVLPIAIDFGVSSLKLLQLASGEPPALIAAAQLATPDNLLNDPAKRLAFQFKGLAQLVRKGGFKGRRAMCALPAAQMFCKHMQFPKTDAVAVGELVENAVPAALGCPREALIYRHFVVDGASPPTGPAQSALAGGAGAGSAGSGQRMEVICLAAAHDLVNRIMGAMRDAKLETVGMHPEAVASMQAFADLNRRAADRAGTLYLDIACGTTKLYIGHATELVFAKTIHLGGRELDQAIARGSKCEIAEARSKRLAADELVSPRMLQRLGTRPGVAATAPAPSAATADSVAGPLAVAMRTGEVDRAALAAAAHAASGTALAEPPSTAIIAGEPSSTPPGVEPAPRDFNLDEPLETLTDEIAMCLRYYESIFPGKKVQRAIFIGGEARHRGLCQYIARRLRMPAQVADPTARLVRTGKEPCTGVDFSSPQPGWAVPFGLALCRADL